MNQVKAVAVGDAPSDNQPTVEGTPCKVPPKATEHEEVGKVKQVLSTLEVPKGQVPH